MPKKTSKPRAYRHQGYKVRIEKYSNIPRLPGGIAFIGGIGLYPADAERLAIWLQIYVKWHDAEERASGKAKG
jgi:hypothetical protein